MKSTQTLSIKNTGNPVAAAPKQRIERSLLGKTVTLQTKSPSRIVGEIKSFDGGWIEIFGTECRWLPDGSLSKPVASGTFTLDRSTVTYIGEVM